MTIFSSNNTNQITNNNDTLRITNFIKSGANINASLGGSECYSMYKAKTQDDHKTTVVVLYIVDGVAIAFASQYMSFDSSRLAMMMLSVKQDLALVSSIVATDYMSRVAIDIVPDEFKESYVDPVFDYANNMINDLGTCMIDGGSTLMGYFNTGGFNQEV